MGTIFSAGFASGDHFVVGRWDRSPIGPMADVMWARPDGERVLLVPTQGAGDFITAVYRFHRVEVVPFAVGTGAVTLDLAAGDVALHLRGGRGWRLPLARLRSAWFTRWLEAPLARALLGVRTYGRSPTGVREWYRADEYRRLVEGRATLAGTDLGDLRPRGGRLGFGFSEPPRQPAMVRVRPLLIDPTGRLDRVVAALG